MSRFFELQMFPAILIGIMALTSIGTGIAVLVIGFEGTTRIVGVIPLVAGALMAWIGTAWAMDV